MAKTKKAIPKPRLTVAQLAKKHEELERRTRVIEAQHTRVFTTLQHMIDDFTIGMEPRKIPISDEKLRHMVNGLIPHLTAIYDAMHPERDKH